MKKENKLKQIIKSKNILLLLLLSMTLSCCSNDDDNNTPTNPIDQLPPATQTGENTIGCLLDGNVFLPGNRPNSTNCFYQFVNGEFYFVAAVGNEDSNFNSLGLGIGTQKKEIIQGETYSLIELEDNNAYGSYIYNSFSNYTSQTYTGELTITKLDMQNQIVSGTFWYDVEDQDGIVHEIRNGRFDMQFTQ